MSSTNKYLRGIFSEKNNLKIFSINFMNQVFTKTCVMNWFFEENWSTPVPLQPNQRFTPKRLYTTTEIVIPHDYLMLKLWSQAYYTEQMSSLNNVW